MTTPRTQPLPPRRYDRRNHRGVLHPATRVALGRLPNGSPSEVTDARAPVFKARDVNTSFGKAVGAYGNPASLLSDNGAVFTGRYRGTGRVALEVTLHSRGISFRHCRPYHPQTCGKVERFHQTLKKWLTHQIPAQTLTHLQAQLDTFRTYYNTVRPQRALGRRTPHQAYLARPKATPTGTPLHTGAYRIRHDRIEDTCARCPETSHMVELRGV